MKRTPRSASRRASRQLYANEPSAPSQPYMSITCFGSSAIFTSSGTLNVITLSQQLIALHAGEVPQTREALETLPGVGRKTANVVLNTAFGQETFAVDTHIFRVGNRTGLAKGKTVLDVERKLEKCVPQPFRASAHHWLILHGRYICKARRPECWRCPVTAFCRYPDKETAA